MKPGIYNITMAEYLADCCPEPSLSSSCAHTLLTRSPVHAWLAHPRLGARRGEDSTTADVGTLAHDYLLGGEGKICVIDAEDWRTKDAKAQRDEARANGLTPVLTKQVGGAKNMAAVARAFMGESELAGIFERGQPEQTIVWQEFSSPVELRRVDGETRRAGGVWCRARPDWLTDSRDVMLHYKTTKASDNPEQFIRTTLPGMGYHVAVAFYARGLAAVCDVMPTQHVILLQSQLPPHACSLIALSPAYMALAGLQVEKALRIWRSCMENNSWPGYSGRIHYADPRPWDLAAAEEAMAEEQE